MRRLTLVTALLLAAVAAADTSKSGSDVTLNPDVHAQGALTDASPQHRPQMASFFVGLPFGYWGYGFPLGVGARYQIPILHDGFIPSINDSFAVEIGADLSLINSSYWVPFISIPVEAMWTLYFLQNFAGYIKLGLALEMSFSNFCFGGFCRSGFGAGVVPIGTIGVMFKLSPSLVLRVEAGYPWLKVGIGIPL